LGSRGKGRLIIITERIDTKFQKQDVKLQSLKGGNSIRKKKNQDKKNTTTDLSRFLEDGTFSYVLLAKEIMREHSFLYTGTDFLVYKDGVFTDNAERIIKQSCHNKLMNKLKQHYINEVVPYIKVEKYIKHIDLNKYPKLICLLNGMYDTEDNKLIPHDSKYLSTIQIPIEYDPKAECPNITHFLETTMDKETIKTAFDIIAYCLIPTTKLDKAFFLHGEGSNGKSVFLKLLTAFIGSANISTIPLHEIDESRFKRASLKGKLVNLSADIDYRDLKNSSYFKKITSGDTIDAEKKFKDDFKFDPFCKLIFSCNKIPKLPNDRANIRRMLILPFNNTFDDNNRDRNRDRNIVNKITTQEELSGLLNIVLPLVNVVLEKGVHESVNSIRCLDKYVSDRSITAFMEKRLIHIKEEIIERNILYEEYLEFCKQEKLTPVSKIEVYNKVRDLGFKEKKTSERRFFLNIGLKD